MSYKRMSRQKRQKRHASQGPTSIMQSAYTSMGILAFYKERNYRKTQGRKERSFVVRQNLSQPVNILQHLAGSLRHTIQRIFCNMHRHTSLFGNQHI